MKFLFFMLLISFHFQAWGYEGPDPLKDIKINVEVTKDHSGKYEYKYKVTNPTDNNGSIRDFNIFLPENPKSDLTLTNENYSHCKVYFLHSSAKFFDEKPGVPVGSSGPNSWRCGYVVLYGESEIAYRWGVLNNKSYIDPGESQRFSLTSEGLPGVRRVQMNPSVDIERLPEEYYGNAEKTIELYNKVRWTGKTVGPKAPPKAFDPTKFIQYIESLLEESSRLGWVKIRGVENSLNKQLRAAEKLIGKGGNHPTQKIMEAFLKEVKRFKKKHLSPEAYALLYYNGQYFLDHLEVKNDHKDHHKDRHGHHDRDHGRHHDRGDHHDHEGSHHQHSEKNRHEVHHEHHEDRGNYKNSYHRNHRDEGHYDRSDHDRGSKKEHHKGSH